MAAQTPSPLKPVYALVGQDGYRQQEALKRLLAFASEQHDVDVVTRMDATADLADALDEVRTYALIGGPRLVVVQDADAFITRYRKPLEAYCAEPSDAGVLVLVCSSMPSNTKLYKAIDQSGGIVRCDAPKGHALRQWVRQQASERYGKQVDERTAEALCEYIGASLAALDGELAKLALFVLDRKQITFDDVATLVTRVREENVFGIIDAIADGDAAAALAEWEQVLATDRAAPERAIGGLAWSLRRLLDLKIKSEQGTPPAALTRQVYGDAGRKQAFLRRLNRTSVHRLTAQLDDLLQIDVASKTGLTTVPLGVEKFIIRHASGQGR